MKGSPVPTLGPIPPAPGLWPIPLSRPSRCGPLYGLCGLSSPRTGTGRPATRSSQQSWHDSCALSSLPQPEIGRREPDTGDPQASGVAHWLRTRPQSALKRLRASSSLRNRGQPQTDLDDHEPGGRPGNGDGKATSIQRSRASSPGWDHPETPVPGVPRPTTARSGLEAVFVGLGGGCIRGRQSRKRQRLLAGAWACAGCGPPGVSQCRGADGPQAWRPLAWDQFKQALRFLCVVDSCLQRARGTPCPPAGEDDKPLWRNI